MQTNYAPNMSLRNKIVTGIISAGIGLASLVSGGCGEVTKKPTPQTQEQNYTPEQIKAWYDYMERRNQEIKANNEAWYAYMDRRNQEIKANNQIQQNNQTPPPTKTQDPLNELIWDVYTGAFMRAGGNIITHEYMKKNP